MAGEKLTISGLTNEIIDKSAIGDWMLAVENPNIGGNPEGWKMSYDTFRSGFLAPDGIGNTSFGGFNATDINILEANILDSQNPYLAIAKPLESTVEEKQRLLPFINFRNDVSASAAFLTPTAAEIDNIVFDNFSTTKVQIPAAKIGQILINIDGVFSGDCNLEVDGISYNTGTTVETAIGTRIVAESGTAGAGRTGIINGCFAVDFTNDVLPGEDLLLEITTTGAVTGTWSITIQGLQ